MYIDDNEIDISTTSVAVVLNRNTAFWNLLRWEQRVGGSNPSAPTIICQHLASISVTQ